MNIEIKDLSISDIDEMITSYDISAQSIGFKDSEELENFKVDASRGMLKFGGSFVRALGEALAHADSNNTFKIVKNWTVECKEHADLLKKHMADKYTVNKR